MLVENIFRSDVAKRVGFLPTTHKLTPQLKGKKMQKKLYILQHETHVHSKEERKEKEEKGEGRRKHG
jgi:hypothetical protein